MAQTLVIRERSGEVVELDFLEGLERMKREGAMLLTSEDARRYRAGALSPHRTTHLEAEDVVPLSAAAKPRRTYKRRDKRAEG